MLFSVRSPPSPQKVHRFTLVIALRSANRVSFLSPAQICRADLNLCLLQLLASLFGFAAHTTIGGREGWGGCWDSLLTSVYLCSPRRPAGKTRSRCGSRLGEAEEQELQSSREKTCWSGGSFFPPQSAPGLIKSFSLYHCQILWCFCQVSESFFFVCLFFARVATRMTECYMMRGA